MTTTRLRRTFRLSTAGALACMLAASWLTFAAPTASAFEQERLFLEKDGSVSVEFPAIPGSNPSGFVGVDAGTDPEACRTSAYCDTIPITIAEDPDSTDDSEYFVVVTVSWDTVKAPPDPVLAPSEGFATNDMDIFMYQDPIDDTRHQNEDGQDYMAHSAGSEEPERFFMFKPSGDYNLVIINFVGANQGYTVDLLWVSESFSPPFESLAPGFTPPRKASPKPKPIPITTTIAPPVTSPNAPAAAPPVSLAPATIDLASGDDGFGQFDSDSDFDDQLAAPAPIDLTPAASSKAAPPSGMALLLWFFAFPLVIMATFSGVLLRRRAVVVTA